MCMVIEFIGHAALMGTWFLVSLQLQESLPHELGGREVIGRAGLTSVEFRSAQGANVRQHAVGGNQLQGLRE